MDKIYFTPDNRQTPIPPNNEKRIAWALITGVTLLLISLLLIEGC
jgi:hypothetical protein